MHGAIMMPPPPTREEALAVFDAARREHLDFLASIPRERMTEPGATGPWSVKDVIAHVTAWRGRTIAGWKPRRRANRNRHHPGPPNWTQTIRSMPGSMSNTATNR